MDDQPTKPKFDKRKWREKKYNHKLQVQQHDKTKKLILKSKLRRQLKKEQAEKGIGQSPKDSSLDDHSNPKNNHERPPRLSRVQQAKLLFQKKQQDMQRLKEEKQKKKEEVANALEAYKKKKQTKFRLLSNKTSRGQPVMKGRMQLLFEQVKKSVGVENLN